MINIQKAAVIGCGFVGASIAYTLMQKGIFSELVLIDAVMEKAEGEAMDISHGLPFAHAMDIYAGTYADIADASILIITAGANQKEGETRLDLVQKNAGIMRSIIGNIRKTAFDGLLLIVSNPVDILTEVALRESGYPEERVIGSAEMCMLLLSGNMATVSLQCGVVPIYMGSRWKSLQNCGGRRDFRRK